MKIKYLSPIIGSIIFMIFNYFYLFVEKHINFHFIAIMLLLIPLLFLIFTISSYIIFSIILLTELLIKKYNLSSYMFLGITTIIGIICGMILGLLIFQNEHLLLKSWLEGITMMLVFVFNTSFYLEFKKLEKETI
jgi:hypothetical protein